MFKNIIFDWSGVVKDAVDAQLWTVNKMFKSVGLREISLEEMKENWEQPYMLFYNKYVPSWSLAQEQEAYYKAISKEDYPDAHSYAGVVELIKKLNKKGVQMVILSSDSTNNIFSEIKQFGLENIFKEVVMDIHDKSEKIHELIEKNRFKKEETIFIGDSNHEVEVGKQAGIKTIAVTWGFCTEKRLKAMDPTTGREHPQGPPGPLPRRAGGAVPSRRGRRRNRGGARPSLLRPVEATSFTASPQRLAISAKRPALSSSSFTIQLPPTAAT